MPPSPSFDPQNHSYLPGQLACPVAFFARCQVAAYERVHQESALKAFVLIFAEWVSGLLSSTT